jgi:hypothetical protein
MHMCIATHIGSFLPDLFTTSQSPSHSGLCQFKITIFAPLKWAHQTHSVFRFDLPFDPAIPLLGIYLKECNSVYYKGTCTPSFIVALFTCYKQAKLWKQPRCPTTNEWIKKMWYLYTMEFYAATKKNEILSFAIRWMELDNFILSKVSHALKAQNHVFCLICRL